MKYDWPGWNITIAERPTNPVDMGISIDPGNPEGAVLWYLDDNGVVHLESLMPDYDG